MEARPSPHPGEGRQLGSNFNMAQGSIPFPLPPLCLYNTFLSPIFLSAVFTFSSMAEKKREKESDMGVWGRGLPELAVNCAGTTG